MKKEESDDVMKLQGKVLYLGHEEEYESDDDECERIGMISLS